MQKLANKHSLLQRTHTHFYVLQRAKAKRKLFRNDSDRQHFIQTLEGWAKRYGIELIGYRLLSDRFHLLVKARQNSLASCYSQLEIQYQEKGSLDRLKRKPEFREYFKALLLQETLVEEVRTYLQSETKPSKEELSKNIKVKKIEEVLSAKKWPLVLGDPLFAQSQLRSQS